MKKTAKKIGVSLIIVIFLAFLTLGGVFIALNSLTEAVDTNDTSTHIFVVKKGQSLDAIALELHEKGLIKHPLAFKVAVAKLGLSKKIQAGSFRLQKSMNAEALVEALTHGTLDLWVTLLEGWRVEEMAAAVTAVYAENGQNFDQTEFIRLAKSKEGFLYPDTYLLPVTATPATVVSILENTFNKKITDKMRQDIKSSGYTLDQIVTMASLIEREANNDQARPLVSGILWKRIEAGWPLQVDATLQYVKGFDQATQSWWTPPLAIDKDLNSPYNTYQNPGLPPSPICSPSLASIDAAINPKNSDYWFYITDREGNMRYAVDIDQHNQNIATYLR